VDSVCNNGNFKCDAHGDPSSKTHTPATQLPAKANRTLAPVLSH